MTDFPTSKDDRVDNVDDAVADDINSLQDKVGIDDDTNVDSLDYKVRTGLISADETWEFDSVDDPTGIMTVPSDATTKYSVGMKIEFTNGGNTIYGIITAVTSTLITFLHEIDPTDSQALHLMADSAITANYYSTQKAPFGFPLSPAKWQILVTDTTNRIQATPTTDVWYNIGSLSIDVPVGVWNVEYSAIGYCAGSNVTSAVLNVTLSTANNSESDANWTAYLWIGGASGNTGLMGLTQKYGVMDLATKDTFYLNVMKSGATASANIGFYNSNQTLVIKAVCAFL